MPANIPGKYFGGMMAARLEKFVYSDAVNFIVYHYYCVSQKVCV